MSFPYFLFFLRFALPPLLFIAAFLLGYFLARWRVLPAVITTIVSLCFVCAFWFFQYPLVDGGMSSVLKVTLVFFPPAILMALILSAICVALILLGRRMKQRILKKEDSLPRAAGRWGIICTVVASLIFPVFVVQDFVPPPASRLASHYDLLLLKQAKVSQLQGRHSAYDEYVFEANGRKLYFQAYVDSNEILIVSDVYPQAAARYEDHKYYAEDGSLITPVAVFSRNDDFPYVRVKGAFISGDFLYYNYGADSSVIKSAFNSYWQEDYRVRDFHFAKINLNTMENHQITRAEYERAYNQTVD